MNTGAGAAPSAAPPSARRSVRRRLIGSGIGVCLLGAVVWALAGQREALPQAWRSIIDAPPWLIGAALALPVLNLAIISLSFWVLLRREGTVGLGEMFALIGAAWLLNFMPLRPGLVGRVAYHRAFNGVPVARAVWVTGVGIVAGAVAVGAAIVLALLLGPGASQSQWGAACGICVGIAGIVTGALAAAGSPAWAYAATLTLRLVDIAVWVLRYAVLFALVGKPISLGGAVAVTAACQAALVVPFIGNGLGVREWAVGLTSGALPPGMTSMGVSGATGLTADLVNRAAEVAVAVPLGLACAAWLTYGPLRRARERSRAGGAAAG